MKLKSIGGISFDTVRDLRLFTLLRGLKRVDRFRRVDFLDFAQLLLDGPLERGRVEANFGLPAEQHELEPDDDDQQKRELQRSVFPFQLPQVEERNFAPHNRKLLEPH